MAFAVHKLHFCFAGCINYISPPLLVSLVGSSQQSAQCSFQAGGECGDKTNGGRVTDPEILIKSSGNTGALLPFEENRVLFRCQQLDSMPSLCFLVSREISDSDLCESKVRERGHFCLCLLQLSSATSEGGRASQFTDLATFEPWSKIGSPLLRYRRFSTGTGLQPGVAT